MWQKWCTNGATMWRFHSFTSRQPPLCKKHFSKLKDRRKKRPVHKRMTKIHYHILIKFSPFVGKGCDQLDNSWNRIKITRYAQPSNLMPYQSTEGLVPMKIHYGYVEGLNSLKDIFNKDLHAPICHSTREYWWDKKTVSLHNFAIQTILLHRLQGHGTATKRTTLAANKQQPPMHRGKPWPPRMSGLTDVKGRSTWSTSTSTMNTSSIPVLEVSHTAFQSSLASSDKLSSVIASLDVLITMDNETYCTASPCKNIETSSFQFIPKK